MGESGTESSMVSGLLQDRKEGHHPVELTLVFCCPEQMPKHYMLRLELGEEESSLIVCTKWNIF